MAENSAIEWTDHTFNPWRGCDYSTLPDGKPHPGCVNCYAAKMSKRNPSLLGTWGPEGIGERIVAAADYWELPSKWNAAAAKEGVRRNVFCASLADIWEPWPGPMTHHKGGIYYRTTDGYCSGRPDPSERDKWATIDDMRERLFQSEIRKTPWLNWLILTKRPWEAARKWRYGHLRNVWLGVSVSDQATADALIPELLKCRDFVPVLFLSCEPLLGPLSIERWLSLGIDWVIAGGESGPLARPMHPHWPRSLCYECLTAGVPFFFKQWGEWRPVGSDESIPDDLPYGEFHSRGADFVESCLCDEGMHGGIMTRVGKHAAGRLLDGREWSQFPQVSV